jgi:hypothetical protein
MQATSSADHVLRNSFPRALEELTITNAYTRVPTVSLVTAV